jgi:hypothetical protein
METKLILDSIKNLEMAHKLLSVAIEDLKNITPIREGNISFPLNMGELRGIRYSVESYLNHLHVFLESRSETSK